MIIATQPTFPNNSALTRGTRVTMTGGYLAAASGTQDECGIIVETVLASDPVAAIVPLGHFGVKDMLASGAIAQYATVWAAASGKITSTPGTLRRGIALQAASGDGSIIPVLPQSGSGGPV